MDYLTEPSKQIPVREECDIFIAGGSCTGVFAAVRAARLGAKVVIAERGNCFGGTATSGLVNVWHSLKDTDYKEQVIAGLTDETVHNLVKNNAAVLSDSQSTAIVFDPNRLKYELDRIVENEKIKIYFHTVCAGVLTEDNRITAAIIENKDGRGAIKAKFYIDATGDGDIMNYLNMPFYKENPMQPPTPCFFMKGSPQNADISKIIIEHGHEFGLQDDFGWSGTVPGVPDIYLHADFHIFDADCSTADGLTFAEIEGRKKAYAMTALLNKYTNANLSVAALCSAAGVRETRHFYTKQSADGMELLLGKQYDDAILNGTYRSDTHDKDGNVTFRYLDGTTVYIKGTNQEYSYGNWRDKYSISGESAKYYQIPFSVLVQEKYENIIAAGRMLNADPIAFGALRVMVNLNQIGEAAGVAAYISIDKNIPIQQVCGIDARNTLKKGGSAL